MELRLHCTVPVTWLSYPHEERVALATGRHEGGLWSVMGIHPVRNVADDPRHCYAVDGRSCKRVQAIAHRTGDDLIGVVHSHLDDHPAAPSPQDTDGLRGGWIGGVFKGDHADWRITWFLPGIEHVSRPWDFHR